MSRARWITYPLGKIVLTVSVFIAAGAWGSTVERLSTAQLIARADVIARGSVTDIKTRRSGQGSASTLVNITVEKQFKGAQLASVIIEQPGGVIGEVTLAVPGTPKFAAGEDVIVFLKRRRDGVFTVVGGPQGKFTARRHAGGEVIEDFARKTEPLDSFVDRLTRRLQSSG
jgi:hypothetical protein